MPKKPARPAHKSRKKTNQPELLPAANGGESAARPNSKAQLSSLIKSARDIMRKDAGLNGDLDRLPQLSWVLFLKCFDDLEQRREAEAVMAGQGYKPVIPKPCRWRDWAADPDKGRTGPELLDFINNDLLPRLRALNGAEERQVIAAVFGETYNRMLSGYLLRDVVNLVNGVNFNSTDDIFTLGHLYESMLKEMRDAAGDSGEFYTPRPVVRFIVDRVAPKIGEKVLDPAAGTGGFLVEAYEYLKPQQKSAADRRRLQTATLFGVEKKPMPYLLGMMNLLLHGLESPALRRDNALKTPLKEIGEKDRFDVIITNPPFGGEEERGIQLNFPEATRASETALLFMQFIMRSLRPGGRCGMVVPNGTLFGDGVAARVKEQLLADFNLHTVIRLPNGVFAPYTSIPTNLLFFDRPGTGESRSGSTGESRSGSTGESRSGSTGESRSGSTGESRSGSTGESRLAPTTEIWYYELPLPEGRKNYTKTAPMQDAEFAECRELWARREVGPRSWLVKASDVAANNYNLDIKNPNRQDDYEHMPPEQLAADIAKKETRIAEIMAEIQAVLKAGAA
jgi:type I restriction enzyme M protein